MWTAAMLPEKYSLPRPQLQTAIDEWHTFARTRQRHFNVTGHIVGAFRGVFEVGIVLWHEPIQPADQIIPRRLIGVFHNHKTAAGVPAKNRR